MPDIVSIPTPYIVAAVGSIVVGFIFLKLYNRREERREWAQKASAICREWGLVRIADLLDAYARGDYSQIVRTLRQFVLEMRTGPAAIANMLWDATLKVTVYVAENDPSKADQLRKLLSPQADVSATKPVIK